MSNVDTTYYTMVYRGVLPGDEARELGQHPKVVALAWGHLMHERDAKSAALAAAQERIEALEAEKAALQRDADRWRTIVPRLLAELGERGRSDGNAPGHAHRVPGVWDSDNGRLAGKTCAWCAVWHEAKTALTLNQKDEQK